MSTTAKKENEKKLLNCQTRFELSENVLQTEMQQFFYPCMAMVIRMVPPVRIRSFAAFMRKRIHRQSGTLQHIELSVEITDPERDLNSWSEMWLTLFELQHTLSKPENSWLACLMNKEKRKKKTRKEP